jgi:hypothetical protein
MIHVSHLDYQVILKNALLFGFMIMAEALNSHVLGKIQDSVLEIASLFNYYAMWRW